MITPYESIGTENGGTGVTANRGSSADVFRTTVDKPFDRVSWGAIFAGALTAIATMLILSLIGLGIGLSTLDPATGDNPSGTAIGIGAVVWWLISNLVALFVGGYVSGRLAGNFNGYLHGLVTWATVSLFMVMMLSSAAGRIFSGASGLAQFAATQAPKIEAVAPGMADRLQDQANDAVNRAQAKANDPKARAQAEQAARDAGEKAATGGALGSFGAALALILGAGAGGMGGKFGKRRFMSVVPERKDLLIASRF
jgi:hypothetical protein